MHLRTITAVILALALVATGLSAAATTGFGKYQDFDRAEADGYIQVSPCVPGMGFHYLNPALFDDTVKVSQGEILVYALNDEEELELVAVEYAATEEFTLLGHTAEFNPPVGGYLEQMYAAFNRGDIEEVLNVVGRRHNLD